MTPYPSSLVLSSHTFPVTFFKFSKSMIIIPNTHCAGEDTDTSSSDATVLSHAQEVLLSGSVGHTSFLQDSIGKNYESRLTDRLVF